MRRPHRHRIAPCDVVHWVGGTSAWPSYWKTSSTVVPKARAMRKATVSPTQSLGRPISASLFAGASSGLRPTVYSLRFVAVRG